MPITVDFIRFALFACILGMALLAAFYLRQRELSLWAYTGWGLLALLLPVIGPFLVIWIRPGRQPLR